MRRAALVIGTLVLGVAGCGGSGGAGGPATLSKADFIAKADALCKAGGPEVAKIAHQASAAQARYSEPGADFAALSKTIAASFSRRAELRDQTTDNIAALGDVQGGGPTQLIAARRATASAFRAAATAFTKYAGDLSDASSQAASKAIVAANTKGTAEDKLARDYGFQNCSRALPAK